MKFGTRRDLSRIDMTGANGDLNLVIETPKGSRNKYKYEPKGDFFELGAVLPEGMIFPFDFGFIPSTRGEDGDPLDVLVLMDAPVAPGIVIKGRLIGALVVRQSEDGKQWERNDRFIAVASHARTHDEVRDISDLRGNTLKDIREFFVNYNDLRDRQVKIDAECDAAEAFRLLKSSRGKRKH